VNCVPDPAGGRRALESFLANFAAASISAIERSWAGQAPRVRRQEILAFACAFDLRCCGSSYPTGTPPLQALGRVNELYRLALGGRTNSLTCPRGSGTRHGEPDAHDEAFAAVMVPDRTVLNDYGIGARNCFWPAGRARRWRRCRS